MQTKKKLIVEIFIIHGGPHQSECIWFFFLNAISFILFPHLLYTIIMLYFYSILDLLQIPHLISDIIEHAVYVLWRHIDYYYVHCVPTDGSFMVSDTSRLTHSRARHLNGKNLFIHSFILFIYYTSSE